MIVLRYQATTFCYKLQIDEARVVLISVLVTLQFNSKLCSFKYPVEYGDTVIFCFVEEVVGNVQPATKLRNIIEF